MGAWSDWILRGLTFLVVSCPCALVISVPLSFFGGIGGASRLGILVKGSNYLELLAHVDTVVFDKTGTLTSGTFNVVAIHPETGVDPDYVLSMAAHAESFSDHPIAVSVRAAYSGQIDRGRIAEAREESGHGVSALVNEHLVLVGNDKLMAEHGAAWHDCDLTGTILHVTVDGEYVGHIVIADVVKDDAEEAVRDLHAAGVRRCVMLTGDRQDVAEAVAERLGIDEVHAQLLPQDKVDAVERLLAGEKDGARLAFVGDGINDAPVLMRADVGVAMGAMGSDAAIEAADVVLMDDRPSKIAQAMRVARKTMRIVWQNIVFAIGVKVLILLLAAFGIANMWLAVFGDVGVAIDRDPQRHALHAHGVAAQRPREGGRAKGTVTFARKLPCKSDRPLRTALHSLAQVCPEVGDDVVRLVHRLAIDEEAGNLALAAHADELVARGGVGGYVLHRHAPVIEPDAGEVREDLLTVGAAGHDEQAV